MEAMHEFKCSQCLLCALAANGDRINSAVLTPQLKNALEVHAGQTDSGEI